MLVDSSGWKAVVCPQLSNAEGDELDFVAATIEKNLGSGHPGLLNRRSAAGKSAIGLAWCPTASCF